MTRAEYTFHATGHENLLGTHRNTLEFTKDTHLTKQGDCIIGVDADFDIKKLKEVIADATNLQVELQTKNHNDSFNCEPNPDFSDDHEIVFRISNFTSERTLGTRATKAAKDIKRELINQMKDPHEKMKITIKTCDKTCEKTREKQSNILF
jgi:hypothetical protein